MWDQGHFLSECYSIACISSTCLAWSSNFDHLPSFESIVSSNRIAKLNSGELSVFEAADVKLSQFALAGERKDSRTISGEEAFSPLA